MCPFFDLALSPLQRTSTWRRHIPLPICFSLRRLLLTSQLYYSGALRRDPHGSVKQIHQEESGDGDNERPSAFPNIMLNQADPGIQQLHGASERSFLTPPAPSRPKKRRYPAQPTSGLK